ncbi:MAG: Gfo/Idh/MocA family oxidoreductase [Candidatus Latescibacterota bacterium]|jgi:predicted dehydrogenase
MEPVKLGFIGCGGIAGAHVNGLKALWEHQVRPFEVVAACDVVEANARQLAEKVAEFQGRPPKVYTDLEQMLTGSEGLEAVDICTLHSEHHTVAVPSLEAGKHVLIEKPLGITMRAGRLILEAAVQARRHLAVAENYRRSPQERARHWAIRQGRIGAPRTFYWQDVGEGMGKWGWRNFRMDAGAGWVLDGGVHFADLFRYQLGTQAQQVYAVTRQYEPYRYDKPKERQGAWPVDVEDLALALITFDDEVVVQWSWQGSAPGQRFSKRVLYGSEGCLDWETGWWSRDERHQDNDQLVAEFTAALSAEERERLFPGGITDAIAVELKDFADAVRLGTVPEVDGLEGYKAEAICLALFESAWHGRPVTLAEIERCETEGYQADINEALGLTGGGGCGCQGGCR